LHFLHPQPTFYFLWIVLFLALFSQLTTAFVLTFLAAVWQFLNLALKQGFTRSNIVSGLVPWNPLAIKRSAFALAATFNTSAQIRSADDHPLSWVIMSVGSVCGDSHATTSASVISPLVPNVIYPTSPNSTIPAITPFESLIH